MRVAPLFALALALVLAVAFAADGRPHRGARARAKPLTAAAEAMAPKRFHRLAQRQTVPATTVRNAVDDVHALDHIAHPSTVRVPHGYGHDTLRAKPHAGSSHGVVHPAKDVIPMSATPTVIRNGDWVTVTWSGVSKPAVDDWIGVYTPANVDVTKTKPVKYLLLAGVPKYLSTGAGTWRFRLLNLRADTAFVLFRGGLKTPQWAAISNSVELSAPNEPLGVHLAMGRETGSLIASWASATPGGVLQYGTESGNYPLSANATDVTYAESDMCDAPATGEGWLPQGIGYLHYALLTDLTPGQQYFYTVGYEDDVSPEYSFVASPAIGADAEFDMFAFGDLGNDQIDGTMNWYDGGDFFPSRNTTQTMAKLMAEPDAAYRLTLHIGDLGYARGYAAEWPNFLDQIEPVASRAPWMVTDGNHESDAPDSPSLFNGTDSGGECGVPYAKRFAMPTPSSDGGLDFDNKRTDAPWYSAEFGSIHFTIMSTEHDFSFGSEQYNFLSADLAAVNRSRTPYVIFAGHRPMYIDSTNTDPPAGDQPVAQALRASVEPLLFQNFVDLALWGHHHSYQRTCPVYETDCMANGAQGPIHLVIGNAGAGLSTNIEPTPPAWFEVVNCNYYGFLAINVKPAALTLRAYESKGGAIVDTFTIPNRYL